MSIKILPRGKRIIYLIIAIIIFGLGKFHLMSEVISSFLTGLCFGMIYLSLKKEGNNDQQ
jgi:hypothetical protein